MARNLSWSLAGAIFVAGITFGLLWNHEGASRAEGPTPPASSPDDVDITPAQRAQLFTTLDREVAELERHGNILKTVVKLVVPTVVHIDVEKTETSFSPSRRNRTVEEAGSGVVIELKGKFYVLTNRHVIKDARLENIQIKLADGREIQPTKTWMDQDTDVAVMSVSEPNMVPARVGNSDKLDIGDFVLAVGSPFGLSHSVTYGIISAKGRRDLELADDGVRFQDFLQTDASINPGNSGGPLLSLRGELIGINTAIASNHGGNEGVGFSIPINMVMVIAKQLIEKGTVQRAFLGVRLDPKFSSIMAHKLGLPRRQGARVTGITPASPADLAKLSVGDVILNFNGIRVDNDIHLVNIVSLTEAGAEIPLVVFRDGHPVNLTVKVGTNAPRVQQTSTSGQ
jgi:serine protease Do